MCAWRRDSAITPVKTEADGSPIQDRRSFLEVWVVLGTALIASLFAAPLIRFAAFPLLCRTTERKSWPLGALCEFFSTTEPLSVEDGQLMVRFQYFRQLVSDKEVIG
jgi:hypothetical protein